MIAAVTGGTGFIGRRLISFLLAKGAAVRVLTRRAQHRALDGLGVSAFVGDLSDPATDFSSFVRDVDTVYHCAGILTEPARMFAVHVDGTRRLAEAASMNVRRWVQLSSVGVYGPCRAGMITEMSDERPVGPYETTKCRSDEIVRSMHDRLEVTILRPTIVFGAGMANQSLLQIIAAVDRRLFFYIGPPGNSSNYIHVDNVVDCLYRCATSHAAIGRTFNLSDWRTMEQLVSSIARALGRTPPRARLPLAPVRLAAQLLGSVRKMPLSTARVDALTNRARYPTDLVERVLGYVPVTSVEAGIDELVAWARSLSVRAC